MPLYEWEVIKEAEYSNYKIGEKVITRKMPLFPELCKKTRVPESESSLTL